MADKRKKSKSRANTAQDVSRKSVVKKTAVAAVIALVVFFCLMFVFSLLCTKKEISQTLMSVLPFVACAVSGLVGGLYIAKNIGGRALLFCLISSAVQCLVVSVVLLLSVGNIGLKTLLSFAVTLLFSALGAVWKMNRKPKRKI